MSDLIALLAGFLAVAAGWAAVAFPRLFGSALWLAASLFGVGILYLFLGAEFLFLVQIIVYVGAIAVLILFTVMLQSPGPGSKPTERLSLLPALAALAAALLFGAAAGLTALKNLGDAPLPSAAADATRRLGVLFLTREALVFEILSVILTVAAIAALVIAKKPSGKSAE